MVKVRFVMRRLSDGKVPTQEVELPAVPRTGEYIDGGAGFAGDVDNVQHYQDENGEWKIKVLLR